MNGNKFSYNRKVDLKIKWKLYRIIFESQKADQTYNVYQKSVQVDKLEITDFSVVMTDLYDVIYTYEQC